MTEKGIKLELDTPELIPMRKGEEIDAATLSEYLRDKLDGADTPLNILQFAGGHANLTYCLKFSDVEYTLRRPPIGPVAATSHDMSREFRILSSLYRAYPPAPRAFLYCEDNGVIGAPFFVMERRCGTVIRGAIPSHYGSGQDTDMNRTISEVLVDTLAQLHMVDYKAVDLQGLGKPEGYMERQIKGWAKRFEKAKTKEIEVVESLVTWFMDNLPEPQSTTLLHNDYRLDNIMLDPKDPASVVAVFDWDMGTLGNPLSDMGSLLSLWMNQDEPIAFGSGSGTMPTQTPGFLSRREATERYSNKTGFDVSSMPYYYAFGQFKIAVVLQQIYYRFHVGQTEDKRFTNFGVLAEMLFNMAHGNALNNAL